MRRSRRRMKMVEVETGMERERTAKKTIVGCASFGCGGSCCRRRETAAAEKRN